MSICFVFFKKYNGTQYFFHSEIIGGTFGTEHGEELEGYRVRGPYIPMWVNIITRYRINSRVFMIIGRKIEIFSEVVI